MTLSEFKDYALAKKQIEYHSFNPNAKFQCVDLANDYIEKVWQLATIIGTNAKDFPEKLNWGMEFVPNTVDYLPEPGEIAVWNSKVGDGAGHISVVLKKGLQSYFYSLDQNWSKPLFVTEEKHSYSNVRGFIRKVSSTQEPMPDTALQECLAQHKDLINQLETEKKKVIVAQSELGEERIKHQETKTELNLVVKELEDAEDEHTKDLERIAVILDVEAEMSQIIPAIETCITYQDEAQQLKKERAEEARVYEKRIDDLGKTLEEMKIDFNKQLTAANLEIARLKKEKPESGTTAPQKSIIEQILEFFSRK